MFGCARRIASLVILVVVAAAIWFFRDDLENTWHRLRGDDVSATVSRATADRAQAKLTSLGESDGPGRVALTSSELQSLLVYRMDPFLPKYVLDPSVGLDDGAIKVRARVPTEQVARMRGVPGPSELMELLPDTTDVEATGHIIPLAAGRVALTVDDVSAAKIPLPKRIIPVLLREVGRVDQPGLPAEAIALRLPEGVTQAYVHGDSLVLLTAAAAARQGTPTGPAGSPTED